MTLGGAAREEPRHQDRAGAGDARLAAAIDDEHLPLGYGLDRLALRVLAAAERFDRIEILARRDVAQRRRLADHDAAGWMEGAHAFHEDVAEAALQHLRRQR